MTCNAQRSVTARTGVDISIESTNPSTVWLGVGGRSYGQVVENALTTPVLLTVIPQQAPLGDVMISVLGFGDVNAAPGTRTTPFTPHVAVQVEFVRRGDEEFMLTLPFFQDRQSAAGVPLESI